MVHYMVVIRILNFLLFVCSIRIQTHVPPPEVMALRSLSAQMLSSNKHGMLSKGALIDTIDLYTAQHPVDDTFTFPFLLSVDRTPRVPGRRPAMITTVAVWFDMRLAGEWLTSSPLADISSCARSWPAGMCHVPRAIAVSRGDAVMGVLKVNLKYPVSFMVGCRNIYTDPLCRPSPSCPPGELPTIPAYEAICYPHGMGLVDCNSFAKLVMATTEGGSCRVAISAHPHVTVRSISLLFWFPLDSGDRILFV